MSLIFFCIDDEFRHIAETQYIIGSSLLRLEFFTSLNSYNFLTFFLICDRWCKYLVKILEYHSFWILNSPPKLFWLHCDILQLHSSNGIWSHNVKGHFFSFHQLGTFVSLLCYSSQKYTDLPVSKMSSLQGRNQLPLPNFSVRPKFSDFFDLCLHWVSVFRGILDRNILQSCA